MFSPARILWVSLLLIGAGRAGASPVEVPERPTFLLVVGAPGTAEFGSNFLHQANLWETACAKINCRKITIGRADDTGTNDLQFLEKTLAEEPREGSAELWLVLLGHGTFDGKEARFNLRGPDLSAAELANWLKPFRRPLVLINTASSSAPFLNKLGATNRVLVTATRSGSEQNFARFGQYFAEAITDTGADLDKDGQVSVLEAFLLASRKASEFYQLDNRLVTEHALLDDNGDGLGTPAAWFRGLRATKAPKENAAVDGLLAQQISVVPSTADRNLTSEQRIRRDALEREILLLREKKSQLPEDDYYRDLERLLLQYAKFYQVPSTALPRK